MKSQRISSKVFKAAYEKLKQTTTKHVCHMCHKPETDCFVNVFVPAHSKCVDRNNKAIEKLWKMRA